MMCRRVSSHNARRRGMVAVFAVVSFTVLLAAAALSLDGGALLTERRHAQETADAAALAAAADLFQHYPVNLGKDTGGTAATSAQTVATANGYTNDGTTSTVTINIPPKSGNFTDANKYPGYVEVIVTYKQPPGLSAFFTLSGSGGGSGSSTGGGATSGTVPSPGSGTTPVSARAVARGQWVAPNPQVIVFDLSAPTSLGVINNTGSVTINSGPVIVNSSSGIAAANGTNVNFTAPLYDVTGGMVGNFTGPASLGVRPTPDPFSFLPPPDQTKLTTQSNSALAYNTNNPPPAGGLQPGIYVGGVKVTGDVSLTLNPGVYYFQGGGFSFASSGNLTGNGVLLYNAPASDSDIINIAALPAGGLFGSGTPGAVTLTPLPDAGQWRAYQGLVIYQDRSSTAPVILSGDGAYDIKGTIYAANASLTITTKSYTNPTTGVTHIDVIGSQYMTRMIGFLGTSDLVVTIFPPRPKQRIVGLVE